MAALLEAEVFGCWIREADKRHLCRLDRLQSE